MKSLGWSLLLGLSLFGGTGPLPESGSLSAVEEQEELQRESERGFRNQKRTAPAPPSSPTPIGLAPARARSLAPDPAPRLGLWISRTHQRSPTV